MTEDKRALEELKSESVRLLRAHQEAAQDERTAIVRTLAGVLVDARSSFTTRDGDPDYRGLSHSYRHWVHDVYDQAQIDTEARLPLQAAVRYHAGAILRERLDPETLSRLGLLKQTPKEQSTARRANRNALLNSLTGGNMSTSDLLALAASNTMLNNVTGKDFASLTDDERRIVDSSLLALQRRAQVLLDLLHGTHGGSDRRQDADGPDYTADE